MHAVEGDMMAEHCVHAWLPKQTHHCNTASSTARAA